MAEKLFVDVERSQLPLLLQRGKLVGMELGVASGDYSKCLVDSGLFSTVYGVDVYGDHHDINEYKSALSYVGLGRDYYLLRMLFDDALALFPDNYFDFVYIDGYAHTGENSGKTIFDWYSKVKVGGIIAGHDYHADWPLVVKAVDAFAEAAGLNLMITKVTENPGPQDRHPSWAAMKINDAVVPFSR